MKKRYIGIIGLMLVLMQVVPVVAMNMKSTEKTAPSIDQSPTEPLIEGPVEAKYGEICNYTAMSTDPQGDPITYVIEFSDAPRSVNEQGPFPSGYKIDFSHTWSDFYQEENPYKIRIKAVDDEGHESKWARFITHVTDDDKSKNKAVMELDFELFEFLDRIFERFNDLELKKSSTHGLFR